LDVCSGVEILWNHVIVSYELPFSTAWPGDTYQEPVEMHTQGWNHAHKQEGHSVQQGASCALLWPYISCCLAWNASFMFLTFDVFLTGDWRIRLLILRVSAAAGFSGFMQSSDLLFGNCILALYN